MNIDKSRLELIDALLNEEVAAGRLPGAVYAVGIGDDVTRQNAIGFAESLHGIERKMQLDTIFDLASLTKVVSTLPSILLLLDRGEIRLEDPVARFIPSFVDICVDTCNKENSSKSSALADAKSRVTLRHLLTHSSGLPSHRQFYTFCRNREEVIEQAIHEPLEAMPDTRVVYSDIGFILLGEIVQRVSEKRIDQFALEEVFRPLSMNQTTYCPDKTLKSRIAATEEFHHIGVKVGVVHDENTHLMEGVSGHAGVFAPLADLVNYVRMWLVSGHSLLSPAVRHTAVTCFTKHLDGRRGLGWTCRHDGYDHTGDMWPNSTVGHTGFTGTSLAFDPISRLWMIFLTNEVHYGRENRTIIRLRNRVHNLVASALTDL